MSVIGRRAALRVLSAGAVAVVVPQTATSADAAPRRFAADAACRAALRRVSRAPGVTFGVGVHDAVSARRFLLDPTGSWEMASTVKVDLLLGLLRRAQVDRRGLTEAERSLATAMIVRSDNGAASRLWADNGGGAGMARLWRRLDVDGMRPGADGRWGLTRCSIDSRLQILQILVDGHPALNAARANEVVWLMKDVRADQRWGVGTVARSGEMTELKNGWLPRSSDGRRWIVNTTGRVHGRDRTAVKGRRDLRMAVFSRGHSSMSSGVEFVEEVLRTTRRSLAI
ncbi:MAG: hypothetical protein IPI32_06785 [Austwickia sp.]|nr:hypothetical protein [Austwickia sp.]MBK8437239.1 hypothetical protein [Austwickia sp.]MBK9102472.1 hypothetical protein [Austwickia sp.]